MAPKMCLKLLIDKENKRVVFAEAGRDFLESISGIGSGCFPRLSQSVTNCLKASLDSEFRIFIDCYFKQDEAGCLPCGCKWDPFLKEATTNTYIITDDLVFTPTSAFKAFTILREFQVNSFETLEERTLYVGTKEITSILLTSFRSKVVLTDVFLAKKMLSPEALKFLGVEEEDDYHACGDEDKDDDEDDGDGDGDGDGDSDSDSSDSERRRRRVKPKAGL